MNKSLRDEVEAIETRIRRLGFTVIANHLRQALARHPSADGVAAHDECLAKYAELIYAVGNKYPGETRHETALRYIRQTENNTSGPAQAGAILAEGKA